MLLELIEITVWQQVFSLKMEIYDNLWKWPSLTYGYVPSRLLADIVLANNVLNPPIPTQTLHSIMQI